MWAIRVTLAGPHDDERCLSSCALSFAAAGLSGRPSPSPCGSLRGRAHEQTFARLEPPLTDPVRVTLDGLLLAHGGQSRHAWLRSRPTAVSGHAMRRELEKRAFLIETVGADRFDLSGLPPNRRSWLAQTGRQQTNQALARMAPERRYPVLMAFCVEALAHQHIHLYGHYGFDLAGRPDGHRPLRVPAPAATPAPQTPNRV